MQLENLENSDSANQSEESAKVNCSNKCPFRYCSAPPSAAVGRRIRKLEEQINLNYQSYGVGQNVWKGEVRNLFGDEVPPKTFLAHYVGVFNSSDAEDSQQKFKDNLQENLNVLRASRGLESSRE